MFPQIDVGTQVLFIDDFLGAALSGVVAGTAENSGTAAVNVGVEGGAVELITGTSDGNRAALTTGLNHKPGSGTLRFATRTRQITNALTRALFIGWTDTVSQEQPIEISGTTITANATDAFGIVYDTAATTDVWYVIGVKNGVATALTALQFDGANIAPTTNWQNLVVTITPDGDGVVSWGEDEDNTNKYGVRELARVDDVVTPTVLLTPIVSIETRSAAAKTAEVDYFGIASARDGR